MTNFASTAFRAGLALAAGIASAAAAPCDEPNAIAKVRNRAPAGAYEPASRSRAPTGRLLDSYGGAQIIEHDSLVSLQVGLKTIATDQEFFDTYAIEMAAGRNFSKDYIL